MSCAPSRIGAGHNSLVGSWHRLRAPFSGRLASGRSVAVWQCVGSACGDLRPALLADPGGEQRSDGAEGQAGCDPCEPIFWEAHAHETDELAAKVGAAVDSDGGPGAAHSQREVGGGQRESERSGEVEDAIQGVLLAAVGDQVRDGEDDY